MVRLSLCFPGPRPTSDQPRARELCLDLLRLNQTHQSMSSISIAASCGALMMLVE